MDRTERSSSQSSELRRVPRVKRRSLMIPGCLSTLEAKLHRNDTVGVKDGSENNTGGSDVERSGSLDERAESSTNDQSSEISSIEPSGDGWIIPTPSSSLRSISEESDLGDESPQSSLMHLLQFAKHNRNYDPRTQDYINKVQVLADFLFGATLHEDAFWLYLHAYLASPLEASKQFLVRILINLNRASTSASQDEIARPLLLQQLRRSHHRRIGEPQENFLLNAFLATIFRRKNELSKADHHAHRAIHYLDHPSQTQNQTQRGPENTWRALAVVAGSRLGYNITEKRLFAIRVEISINARQQVCARASDQLILALKNQPASDTRSPDVSYIFTNSPSLPSTPESSPSPIKYIAIRSLYEWCLHVLENTSTPFSELQPWRKFRAKGMKLRTIGITTLYCQLWHYWHSAKDRPSPVRRTASASILWAESIRTQLGIAPHECLAAVPETIAFTWPFDDDESLPLLANWRTYLDELGRRAISELKALLGLPDVKLMHFFLQAYAAGCIATHRPTEENKVERDLLRECVMAFIANSGEIDLKSLDPRPTQSPLEISPLTGHGSSSAAASTLSLASSLSSGNMAEIPQRGDSMETLMGSISLS